MAVIERTAGSLTEALQLAELAAERYARALPQKHPYILAARMNAAVFISELGEADEALPALRELHGQLAEQLGDHHPDALRCEANLALVLAKVGRAGQDVDEVDLERRLKSRFGSSHPAVKAFQERDYLHRILDPHPY